MQIDLSKSRQVVVVQFLATLTKFGQFWAMLDNFGQVCASLGKFGKFWATLGDFGQFWASLGRKALKALKALARPWAL